MASDKIEKIIDELMKWPYDTIVDIDRFNLTDEERFELYEAVEERQKMYEKTGEFPEPVVM